MAFGMTFSGFLVSANVTQSFQSRHMNTPQQAWPQLIRPFHSGKILRGRLSWIIQVLHADQMRQTAWLTQ